MSHGEDGSPQSALIAFGSNMGDRNSSWHEALSLLTAQGIEILRVSRLLETAPVGGPDGQSSFLNSALTVGTTLPAGRLVEALLAVERDIGRVRETRWGSRLVDLDLMLYEQQIHDSGLCLVPHPRLTFRRFMLEPACEIATDWIHPITKCSLGQLLEQLDRVDRRAVIRTIGTDMQTQRRDVDAVARWLEHAGWALQTDLVEPDQANSGSIWTIVITDKPHPPAGLVTGPYLILLASEKAAWESELRAAVQAMSK